jgi:hypothetical protein
MEKRKFLTLLGLKLRNPSIIQPYSSPLYRLHYPSYIQCQYDREAELEMGIFRTGPVNMLDTSILGLVLKGLRVKFQYHNMEIPSHTMRVYTEGPIYAIQSHLVLAQGKP